MADSIRDVMTSDPRTVEVGDSLVDAAVHMRDGDVGSVIVVENGEVTGILTDRDIAVRAVAEGRDPSSTKAGDVCTRNPTTLNVDQSIDDAIKLMRDEDVRRLPVVDGGRPAGIVSLGDLAMERDPESVLGDISSAPPDN